MTRLEVLKVIERALELYEESGDEEYEVFDVVILDRGVMKITVDCEQFEIIVD